MKREIVIDEEIFIFIWLLSCVTFSQVICFNYFRFTVTMLVLQWSVMMDESVVTKSGSSLHHWDSSLDTAPVIPLLERSCSDCGVRRSGVSTCSRRTQGKFRRVLSETWYELRIRILFHVWHETGSQCLLVLGVWQRKVDLSYARSVGA